MCCVQGLLDQRSFLLESNVFCSARSVRSMIFVFGPLFALGQVDQWFFVLVNKDHRYETVHYRIAKDAVMFAVFHFRLFYVVILLLMISLCGWCLQLWNETVQRQSGQNLPCTLLPPVSWESIPLANFSYTRACGLRVTKCSLYCTKRNVYRFLFSAISCLCILMHRSIAQHLPIL